LPTREQLTEDARALSNVELLDRLRGKRLTEFAQEVTRNELVARGVNIERALSEPLQTPLETQLPMGVDAQAVRKILGRVVRFPLRAVLGVDPLWAVFLFGGAIVLGVWTSIRWGLAWLATLYPIPPYALPIGYAALGFFALIVAWWGIALWRTGGQCRAMIWMLLARGVAVICAFVATYGTMGAARVVQEYFSR